MRAIPPFCADSTTSNAQYGRRYSLKVTLALVVGALSGCGKTEGNSGSAAAQAQLANPQQAYSQIAQQGKGFTVGALMSAHPVYVLFDPQCPHCGHLWKFSQPLLGKVKFVWIPISLLNGKSAPQGAAILSASNPAELMAAHEASMLAGAGGIPLPETTDPQWSDVIKANTRLFDQLAAESVPYVVAKNLQTGQFVAHAGALETSALAAFLGVAP